MNVKVKYLYNIFFFGITLSSINMEAEVISEILLKAASEPEFRKKLIKNPDKILECYTISREAKYIVQKSIKDLVQ
jgi:hypothetical protein